MKVDSFKNNKARTGPRSAAWFLKFPNLNWSFFTLELTKSP